MVVAVGNIVNGVVTGITKFGAFVKLEDGTTGLVHISEVADTYVKEVSDFLKEQDEVRVKVMSVGDNGKVSLSIKQAIVKKPAPAPAPEPQRARVAPADAFEDKLADFMKNSNEKLLTLKKHQDGRKGRK